MTRHDVVTAAQALSHLNARANARDAAVQQGFFKTGPGEYGEGDIFIGVRVPVLRAYARHCDKMPPAQIKQLLSQPIHEARLLALIIMRRQYEKGDTAHREKLYKLYLSQLGYVNNWDLVDASAMYIVGAYLEHRDRTLLYKLIRSPNMWRRRVAIIASYHFIKNRDYGDTLNLLRHVLQDKEDLVHKAAGWMLREVAKRDTDVAERFIKEHLPRMPRTMLRYAIEKFGKAKRKAYLSGNIT